MARIVIELTNRCNLSCGHCFDARHAATGDLSLEILDKVLREGKSCGIEQLSFSGGEPTMHRRFRHIIDRVSEADSSGAKSFGQGDHFSHFGSILRRQHHV